jgi:hypothetical protein
VGAPGCTEPSALISIKLKDRSKSKQIWSELEAKVSFQAVDIDIKGKLDKTNSDMSVDGDHHRGFVGISRMALSLIGLSRVSRSSRWNLKATDAQMKLQEQLRVDLTNSQRKLEESEQQRRALENAKEVEDKLQVAEAARHELK